MKRFCVSLLLILFLVTTSFAGNYWANKPPPGTQIDAASDLNRGLVLYWSLLEGAGSVAQDLSPFRHNGIFVGTPQWVGGSRGAVLSFDGSSWVETPASPDFAWDNTFAIRIWVKYTSLSFETRPVAVSFPTQPNAVRNGDLWISAHGGAVADSDNKIHVVVRPLGHADTFEEVISATALNDNVFHHIFFQRTPDGTLELWVDGNLSDFSGAGFFGRIGWDNEEFGIGEWNILNGWVGELDGLAVWKDRSFSRGEIQADYQNSHALLHRPTAWQWVIEELDNIKDYYRKMMERRQQ